MMDRDLSQHKGRASSRGLGYTVAASHFSSGLTISVLRACELNWSWVSSGFGGLSLDSHALAILNSVGIAGLPLQEREQG